MKKKIQKYLSGEREGFSLIELIIVIAIMAILIGVVALVVLPYLESSRESTDRAALNEVATAFKSAMTSAEFSEMSFSKKEASELASFTTDNGVKLSEKVDSYLEKKLADISFGSKELEGAKLYFDTSIKERGFIVYLSKDGDTALKDSNGVPYTSDRKAFGNAQNGGQQQK